MFRQATTPKKDFFNTGTNFFNSVTLTTGNKTNQTFASISSTNSAGIVPNNEYNRLNITIRNSSSFLNDKLQLDLSASFVKQDDKNMVSQDSTGTQLWLLTSSRVARTSTR